MSDKAVFSYLYCFWHVAKCHSFTHAAEILLISQSAVSYQIKQLEDQLGVSLLEREKRSAVRLTANGKLLADQCQDIFHNLELTIDAIKGKTLSGELIVAAPTCFGSMILGDLLSQLRLSHPEMKVHLRLSDEHVDLRAEQIDMAFRTVSAGMGHYTQPLIKIPMCLVASKHYADKNGLPKSLEELHEHNMIFTNPKDRDWRSLREQRIDVPTLTKNVTYIDNVWGILHAVESSLGLSYLPLYTVSKQIKSGEFVEVLTDELKNAYMIIYLSSPYKTDDNPKVAAVIDGLNSFLKDDAHQDVFFWLERLKDAP